MFTNQSKSPQVAARVFCSSRSAVTGTGQGVRSLFSALDADCDLGISMLESHASMGTQRVDCLGLRAVHVDSPTRSREVTYQSKCGA